MNVTSDTVDMAQDGGRKKRTESRELRMMANPQDEERPFDEYSPLIHSVESGQEDDGISRRLWKELSEPWPSTYERSISLLASPVISPHQVQLYTQSPKPSASPMSITHLRHKSNESPVPQSSCVTPSKGHPVFGTRQSFDSAFTSSCRIGRQKLQANTIATLEEEKRKAEEAKTYRQQILKEKMVEKHFNSSATSQTQQTGNTATEGKATFVQCVFNMANILMVRLILIFFTGFGFSLTDAPLFAFSKGVGLLGLPFAFRCAGWMGGAFTLAFFGFITWKTSILIGHELNGYPRSSSNSTQLPNTHPKFLPLDSERVRKPLHSFPEIARESFGNFGCLLLSCLLYFELFSCICIFLVSLGDHLHSVFPSISVTKHTIIVGAVSILPTVILRTPRLLSYLSMVGTLSTIAVVTVVLSDSILEGDLTKEVADAEGLYASSLSPHILLRPTGLPLAIGIVAYCFSGHAIVPSIYSTMKQPEDFDKMITTSYCVVLGCCFVVGVSGYYMFGLFVEDQVTLSLAQFSSNALVMKCLTWMMIMTAFSKLSLEMFPLALGMEELVASHISTEEGMFVVSCIIKLIVTFLAVLVAVFVPSFSILCAIVGLICTVVVSVIFPAAAHLKLFDSELTSAEKLLDWFLVVFGCVAAIVGTLATLQDIFIQ